MKLISIPFSGGGLGHGDGADQAPAKIIECLEECYADEDGQVVAFEHETITVDEHNVEESHDIIEEKIAAQEGKAVILGGDHSITCPCVKGFAQGVKDFWLVVFDAHPDLMDNFSPPTQEDYLRVLIEEGVVQPQRCIIIGVRNWDVQEVAYLQEKPIISYTMQDIAARGIATVMTEAIEKIDGPIYLSIDIDAVDPVQAIGTGYLEHGGMSSRDLLTAVQALKRTGRLAMADIVEVNPSKDVKDMTSKLAAKLVTELANY